MNALDELAARPRQSLATLPTPLQPARRLSAELSADIWIKRDDLTGLAMGGNKVRKLEFLIGDAIARGCDTVVTFGALQSNHGRQTAAACASVGLRCHLILTRSVPRTDSEYLGSGNLLLDELFGSEIHLSDPDDASLGIAIETVEQIVADDGGKARWIPPGGSEPIGALGYAAAGLELAEQCKDAGISVDQVFHASATGGTQSGLLAGFQMADFAADVCGVAVYAPAAETAETVELLRASVIEDLGASGEPREVRVLDGHMGEGYGIPTDGMREALATFARSEGIALDPVYSGKAAAGLISAARAGELEGTTVFLHTGGNPGLFAYGRDIFA